MFPRFLLGPRLPGSSFWFKPSEIWTGGETGAEPPSAGDVGILAARWASLIGLSSSFWVHLNIAFCNIHSTAFFIIYSLFTKNTSAPTTICVNTSDQILFSEEEEIRPEVLWKCAAGPTFQFLQSNTVESEVHLCWSIGVWWTSQWKPFTSAEGLLCQSETSLVDQLESDKSRMTDIIVRLVRTVLILGCTLQLLMQGFGGICLLIFYPFDQGWVRSQFVLAKERSGSIEKLC